MNILLTGGNGFIGKNIKEQMSTKHNIISPSHKELDLTNDASVNDFFSTNNIEVVIHGAVKPGHRNSKDASNQLYNNTRMFFNLVNNSEHFKKLIYLGSGSSYDMENYKSKMQEEYFGCHIPKDEHGFSKYICGKYMEKLDYAVELRIFGVFGKYEDYAIRFISNVICKTLFDLPITIKQNKYFDYLFIDDLMPILDYFIENKPKHISYNITPDKSISLLDLAEIVRNHSGKDLPIIIGESGYGTEYTGDNSRLKEEINSLQFTPIDLAIKKLYDWYRDNIGSLDKKCLLVDK